MEQSQSPVTIIIQRTARPGREAEFERAMKEFIPRSLEFCGHFGVHVEAPGAEHPRTYTVVLKFASRERWNEFQVWPEYVEWKERIRPLLKDDPVVREQTGLESWVAMPGANMVRVLPRWKMAVATLVGVYPTSVLLALVLAPQLGEVHPRVRDLIFSAAMVALLTFVVMPLVTRALHRWLHPNDSEVGGVTGE